MAAPGPRRGGGGAIISYQLVGLDPSQHTRFAEKVLGQDQRVKGRTYRRRGLLDSVPHWKVNRGVLVVKAEDRAKVVREIRRWTPEVVWWPIPLTRAQRRRIQGPPEQF
jgi:hypothetical protein